MNDVERRIWTCVFAQYSGVYTAGDYATEAVLFYRQWRKKKLGTKGFLDPEGEYQYDGSHVSDEECRYWKALVDISSKRHQSYDHEAVLTEIFDIVDEALGLK